MKSHLIAALFVCAFLQGCCVFGFQTERRMEWIPQRSGLPFQSADRALSSCEESAYKACAQRTIEECRRFTQAPSSTPVYSVNSGRRVSGEVALARHLEYCQNLLEHQAATPFMMCGGATEAVESCMMQRGFVQAEQVHLRCAAMKLF